MKARQMYPIYCISPPGIAPVNNLYRTHKLIPINTKNAPKPLALRPFAPAFLVGEGVADPVPDAVPNGDEPVGVPPPGALEFPLTNATNPGLYACFTLLTTLLLKPTVSYGPAPIVLSLFTVLPLTHFPPFHATSATLCHNPEISYRSSSMKNRRQFAAS